MNEKYLITASLLDSWTKLLTTDYLTMAKFMSVLRREQQPQSEQAKKGEEFETYMQNTCPETFNGQYQVKLSRVLKSSSNTQFLVYGRLDCLKAGKVYDYKFTQNYEVGKFAQNFQSQVYLYLVPEATEMVYIIGINKPKILRENENDKYYIYHEEYSREDLKPLKNIIDEFEDWLKSMGLWEEFKKYWKSF